jgi:uncharacterized protein with ATP-grasp and redox domains
MKLTDIDMNVHVDCFPCFLRQANIALSAGEADKDQWREVLKAVLEDIGDAEFHKTPSHASTRMHRRIRQMLGRDPFARLKSKYNDEALALLPLLKEKVRASSDPLATAARLAIAGNIIDFGIFRSVDIEGTVERALREPLGVDHGEMLHHDIRKADDVLYLLDNAGEIVFDMLLIAELQKLGKKVTAVVRGGPILNDATLKDAMHVGLDTLCEVIDNGTDSVGTVLEEASPLLRERFGRSGTLVISKGQGNFETLIHEERDIYHLFQAKCDVVADALGLERSAMLLMRGGMKGVTE